jgi:hypothetical protein
MANIDLADEAQAAQEFDRLPAEEQRYLREMGIAVGEPGWWLWALNPEMSAEHVRTRRDRPH